VKGSSANGWLYGAVFWPGQNGIGPGCQWAANGQAQITGSLVCYTLQQQGGTESSGPGIFSAQVAFGGPGIRGV
jgi:hypothetical protein